MTTPSSTAVATSVPSIAAPRRQLPLWLKIVVLALCFRLVGMAVGLIANVTIPDYQNQGFTVFVRPNPFWDRLARFDSGWYHSIASKGYRYVEGGRSNLAFFPLYPQLMSVGGRLLGGAQQHFYYAGIAVSWIAFAVAIWLLYLLARLDVSEQAALRAGVYAAMLPSSYFFGAVYSESLFLLKLVGAVYTMRTRRWMWAAVAGAAMTATRVNGIMFVPALGWLAWQASRSDAMQRIPAMAAVAASLAGIGAYCAFNYQLSGNPFEWYASIERWGYSPGGSPLAGLSRIANALVTHPMDFLTTDRMAPYDTLNAGMATLALVAVPFIWRSFGLGYAAVVVLGLVLPLSSGETEGLGRYCSVLFPIPILLGSLSSELAHLALLTTSVRFYTLESILFTNVHPLF